jgi:hypothetical protein
MRDSSCGAIGASRDTRCWTKPATRAGAAAWSHARNLIGRRRPLRRPNPLGTTAIHGGSIDRQRGLGRAEVIARLSVLFTLVFVALMATPSVAVTESGSAHDVRLAHGALGSYAWEVAVHRGDGPNGFRRPCLVAFARSLPPSTEWAQSRLALCGSLGGSQILVANSSQSGAAKRTVLGLAFRPEIAAVRIWLQGRRSRTIALSMLGVRQARSAGVMRFRYAAGAFAGRFCLRRFETLDRHGRSIELSPSLECGR